MKKLARWLAARVIWLKIKKAFRRLPEQDQENLMQKWFQSRAQWARVVLAIGAFFASIGFMPDWVPLFNKLAQAITNGDGGAIVGTLLAFAMAVIGFFDREKKNKVQAKLLAATKENLPTDDCSGGGCKISM